MGNISFHNGTTVQLVCVYIWKLQTKVLYFFKMFSLHRM